MTRNTIKDAVTRFRRSEEGAVMVEFVMVLWLLFAFLFIMVGVGQGLWYHHVVTEGVRDGVRYLSRAPLDATNIDNSKRMALSGAPDGSAKAFTFWNDLDTIDVTTTSVSHGGTLRGPDPLIMVRMTATVPVEIPVLSFFGLDASFDLIASDEARHIGE